MPYRFAVDVIGWLEMSLPNNHWNHLSSALEMINDENEFLLLFDHDSFKDHHHDHDNINNNNIINNINNSEDNYDFTDNNFNINNINNINNNNNNNINNLIGNDKKKKRGSLILKRTVKKKDEKLSLKLTKSDGVLQSFSDSLYHPASYIVCFYLFNLFFFYFDCILLLIYFYFLIYYFELIKILY